MKKDFFYLKPKIEYESVQKLKNEIPVNTGTYIQGILGAYIGAFVSLLPWIYLYVRFEMLVYLIPLFTFYSAFKGYEFFNGRASKAIIPILLIVTYSTLIFVNIVVMPELAAKYNYLDIQAMYSSKQYMQDIAIHVIRSSVYAFVGFMFAFSDVDMYLGSYEIYLYEDDIRNFEKYQGTETRLTLIDERFSPKSVKELDMVKYVFYRRIALDSKNAISKETILNNLYVKNPKRTFRKYRLKGVIKKSDGKYYYCDNKERNIK